MTINILGTGAIGSALAAGAAKHNVPYRVFSRTPATAVTVVSQQDEQILLHTPLSQPAKLDNSDILILPLKAHQIAPALQQWQPYVSEHTPVILMHNGMGGAEIARHTMPDNPVFLATTRMGALTHSKNHVRITGHGTTDIGFIDAAPGPLTVVQEQVLTILQHCLKDVVWHSDIYPSLWHKLSINAVINPLTALHDVPNGALLSGHFDSQIEVICSETAAVMRASGISADAALLAANVRNVAAATATNYSSMHQDVAHHRQTEIDAINGYIVQQATKKGISVPENALLVKQITALTQR
ncbi:ketopantoate reductase family protein [Alteromonas sp. H39]|uniref:ketopantoate reductase family protein n=1 Tax=Alteromonas sp. H39 TaxID=3389876 RepID=UPI0039E0C910